MDVNDYHHYLINQIVQVIMRLIKYMPIDNELSYQKSKDDKFKPNTTPEIFFVNPNPESPFQIKNKNSGFIY